MSSYLVHAGEIGGLLGIIGGASWFLWSRYQALEARLDSMEKSLLKLNFSTESLGERLGNNHEQAIYFCGNNKSLIDHRSKRLLGEIKALETRTTKAIDDLKRDLPRVGDFKPGS